jgi:putative oxidoreductase
MKLGESAADPASFLKSLRIAIGVELPYATPLVNGGDLAVVLCFVFLYLAFAGGGPWGIDRGLNKS